MAPRSVATATLSFGLVSIPVKLFTAVSPSSGVSFNLLHKGCGSRLRQQYVCAKEGSLVERDAMTKGYEFSKDQFVVFSPEELEALEAKATQTIDIAEFLPATAVDALYYDKPYFLAPDKGGERAYRLLGEAMRQTQRVALARYAARGKQYLVMVRPVEGGIALQQLYYADEVRTMADIPIPEGEVKEAEVALAKQLIAQISSDEFVPSKYEDDVKKRVLEAIQRKVEGAEVTSAVAAPGAAPVVDIMAALLASLQSPAPAANEGTKKAEGAEEAAPDSQGPSIAKAKAAATAEVVKPKRAKKATGG